MDGARRAEELCVAVGEDAAVGGHQPVAAAVGSHGHADDGLVELNGARRTVEVCVPVREDAAVGGDQPIAAAVGGGRHADDRLVEVEGAGRAHEGRVAVVEDAPVGGDDPVPLPGVRGGHPDRWRVQGQPAAGPEEAGVAEVHRLSHVVGVRGGRCAAGGQGQDRRHQGEAPDQRGQERAPALLLQVSGCAAARLAYGGGVGRHCGSLGSAPGLRPGSPRGACRPRP